MLTSPAASVGESTTGRDPTEQPSGPLDDAIVLAHELRGVLHDQLQLVACEARLAVHCLTTMVTAAVVIGVLLVTAWLGVMAAAALGLIGRLDFAPATSVLVLAALNLLLALFAYRFLRRQSLSLGFPATLRSLTPAAAHGNQRSAP